jgi:curved DNA-binding protein CbpA
MKMGSPSGASQKPAHYKILQVKKDATEKEILSAYRRLAKKYHPDVKGGNAAKFEQIHESYFVLSDYLRRREYDKQFNAKDNIISNLFKEYAYSFVSGVLLVYSGIFFVISFLRISSYYLLFLILAVISFAASIFLILKKGER